MIEKPKTRVLVVDDSALMRKMISNALREDPEIEVVGAANDPYMARDDILALNPDVLTLDIEMPHMDGLTFLKILEQHHPMPVVVISSLTQTGSRVALEALESGAVDVLGKPTTGELIPQFTRQLVRRVKGAAGARRRAPKVAQVPPTGELTAGALPYDPRQLILFGASTGGTEALKEVLPALPGGLPGICIVQHIPPYFSKAFAERLNGLCRFEVREAAHGDAVRPGLALLAPGDYHMAVAWHGEGYRVALNQRPPVHYVRPAVDVLFYSASECAGARSTAVLLTGMGADGAAGMKKLKAAGARTLAQNEETCVVYGMPRAAMELGGVDQLLPLERIPSALLECVKTQARAEHAQRTSEP